MKLPKGVTVPRLDEVHESYEMIDRDEYLLFAVNISEEKIEPLLKRFCETLEWPAFFIIETPTNAKEEAQLRMSEQDPFHHDVHYLPNRTKEGIFSILDRYGELLIQDGMVRFGVASHVSRDEIFVGQYKLTNIFAFTRDEKKYKGILNDLGIPEEVEIKTVWDTFTEQSPGDCCSIQVDGLGIVKALEPEGLFFAKRIDE